MILNTYQQPFYALGYALLIVLISGCASYPALGNLTVSGREQVEIKETPFYPQKTNQCGAASLATMLAHRGVEISLEGLERQVYLPGRQGSLSIELTAQARQHQMLVHKIPGSMDALLDEIAAGNPVMVLQNLGFDWFAQWHYAVVVGYDLKKRTLILRSGETKRHEVALKTFYATWRRGDFWGVVIAPPHIVPVSSTLIRFLDAASEHEQVGQLDTAQQAYLTVLRRWPDHRLDVARLGLANIAYHRGEYAIAKEWLRSAILKDPYSLRSWNNMAFTLLKMNCHDQALTAIQCAVVHSNHADLYLESQAEIMSAIRGTANIDAVDTECVIPRCFGLNSE